MNLTWLCSVQAHTGVLDQHTNAYTVMGLRQHALNQCAFWSMKTARLQTQDQFSWHARFSGASASCTLTPPCGWKSTWSQLQRFDSTARECKERKSKSWILHQTKDFEKIGHVEECGDALVFSAWLCWVTQECAGARVPVCSRHCT